jgi:uncharacterized phiE125 gp8 family phage protein
MNYPHSPYSAPMQPRFVPSMLGPLELVTAPVGNVVSLGEAKASDYISVADDDQDILDLIAAATSLCQQIGGGRQYLQATYDVPVRGWWGGVLKMPLPPLVSVVSITYYDSNNSPQVLDPSIYMVRYPLNMPGYIERVPTMTWPLIWPACIQREFPIMVRIVCGYATAAQVPPCIRRAIRMAMAFLYENRGDKNEAMPDAIAILLSADGYGSYA